jgi:hypothetical protein
MLVSAVPPNRAFDISPTGLIAGVKSLSFNADAIAKLRSAPNAEDEERTTEADHSCCE